MTWLEFKELLEAAGVKDDHQIGYIDVSNPEAPYVSVDFVELKGEAPWLEVSST